MLFKLSNDVILSLFDALLTILLVHLGGGYIALSKLHGFLA